MAKSLLKSKGYKIEEIDRSEVSDEQFPFRTVPQIWINGSHIGGYSELAEKIGTPEKQYGDCAACEG